MSDQIGSIGNKFDKTLKNLTSGRMFENNNNVKPEDKPQEASASGSYYTAAFDFGSLFNK